MNCIKEFWTLSSNIWNNMSVQEPVRKRIDECAALWYEWERLWRSNKLGTKEARQMWCEYL